ncbi:MAG: hypothetical protein M3478_02340 [Planctomycetota bacterium]|nr:hypothetical protein [Planctomycetota bacterium]
MTRAALLLVLTITAANTSAATKPAPPDPLIEAAVAAVDAGTLPAFAATVERAASDALTDPATANLPRLVQLATLREFARWFARVPNPSAEQKAALTWVIRQRRTAPALLLSATSSDPPDRVLALLTALRKEQPDRLEQFPELTAAVCLVWDDPDRLGGEDRPMDPSRVVRVFRYYADNPGPTRDVANDLPIDQLIFVVDNLLSEPEIEWVRRQYAQVDVGHAFFEVGYGPTRELKREPKPDDDPANSYTLANLRKSGGRMADQAYYAAQIGKTLGIPTATCTGLEREGQESQAWVAFQRDGRWDTTSGRHRQHLASLGEVMDPQTMDTFPPGELALVAAVSRTSTSNRTAAIALCKLMDLAPADKQVAAIKRAVELSPSDRRVWRRVADWGEQHRPGSDEYMDVVGLITAHLLPRSEEAALHVRLRMIAKVAAEDRAALLAEMRSSFERRPDLVATVQLARAAALMEKKDADGALRVLGEVLAKADTLSAHAVPAMRQVEDILRERSRLERLAEVYDDVWSRMRPPPQSPVAHTTPYYAIGQEYAQLLEELGRKRDVERIRERLGELWAEPVRR